MHRFTRPVRLLPLLLSSCLAASMLAGEDVPANHPRIGLSNGVAEMDLYLPDPERGYYRGTRFDWSGVISSLRYLGHEFFGEWQDVSDPTVHDRICGPVESFQTDDEGLGYGEAKVGEGFVKIGIGVLAKPRERAYRWAGTYRILDPGKWTVEHGRDWIEFRHELTGPRGFGYVYTKKIGLTREPAGFTIDHSLENTGTRVIETDQYNHNFFVIDGQPSGPDFRLRFPYDLTATHDLKDLMKIEGKELRYLKRLGSRSVFTGLEGFGTGVKDHRIELENRKSGVGVRISVDRPLHRLNFWSIRTTVCPENYIFLRIPPAARERWRSTYVFYTLDD